MNKADIENNNDNLTFKKFISLAIWSIKKNLQIYPVIFIFDFLRKVFSQLEPIVRSYLVAQIVNALINNKSKDPLIFIISLLAFKTISITLSYAETYTKRFRTEVAIKKLDQIFYNKISRISIGKLEDPKINNLVHLTKQNLEEILKFGTRLLTTLAPIVSIITAGAIIISLNWYLIPVFLILLIPRIILYNKLLGEAWQLYKNNTEGNRKAHSDYDILTSPIKLYEVKLNNTFSFFHRRYKEFYDTFHSKLFSKRKLRYIIGSLHYLLSMIVVFLTILEVMDQFNAGIIPAGDIIFYIENTSRFSSDVSFFASMITAVTENASKLNEVYTFFNLEELKDDETKRENIKVFNNPPVIDVKNLNFSYPNTETKVLNDINLKINPKEKIALVGHNGAGKTTLIKLLMRMYDPESGEILINDKKLRNIDLESWYKNLSVLHQEFNRYEHLTVEENIILGDLNKNKKREEIKNVAKQAEALNFIQEYDKRFQTVLSEKFSEGTRPSTGQWQKLAIARFLYRDTPIVIMDEPTAAIDPVSEYKIFNNIFEFLKDKTVIIISHRFSTVKKADRIFVMDHGEVIERGTHDELIKMNGVYKEAFTVQSEEYRE